ncbi:MAG: VOC family protein [Caldilineaceae bacterium]
MKKNSLPFTTTNTILYCQQWQATVAFYRDVLNLPVAFASDWFVEFALTDTARLSIADERRATIKSSAGAGITLTFQVTELQGAWQHLEDQGAKPGLLRRHAWGAQVFYLYDPEGHRLEFWSPETV